jgi:hypothetical protein
MFQTKIILKKSKDTLYVQKLFPPKIVPFTRQSEGKKNTLEPDGPKVTM